jgi:hypothetical protein
MSNILQCKDNLEIIRFLQNRNLLNKSPRCKRCEGLMSWEERINADGYTWRCDDCDTYRCVRHGSFFSSTRINLTKILPVINAFVTNANVSQTAKDAGIGRTSLTTFNNHLK